MIPIIRVKVGNQWITVDSLLNDMIKGTNDAEVKAFAFIRRWTLGQQEFTYQTSGSTGTPKTITFTRSQLEASARITIDALNLQPGMTALVCLNTDFVAGSMMLVRCLVAGMNIIVRPPSSNPLKGVQDSIDFAAFVPLQVSTLLKDEPEQLDRIANIIIGGAPIPSSLALVLQSRPGSYFATYGMTETLTHVALQRMNGPDRQATFHLLPGISAIADKRGCISIVAKHLGDSPITTNDLVEFVSPTDFRILGRIDNVINSGGYKIHTTQLEEVIHQGLVKLGLSQRFLVFGKPDDQLGEQVCLLLEGEHMGKAAEAALTGELLGLLQKYEMPKSYFYLKKFKETPTQKINRHATLQMFNASK
jgi:O-succinylbenzoic acid--CoA ligase